MWRDYYNRRRTQFWFSGDDAKQQHGVNFIVDKTRIKSLISCTPVSNRIITIHISTKPKNITIMQVYAPTSTYDDDLMEEFYEQLESIIEEISRKYLIIIFGSSEIIRQWACTLYGRSFMAV